MSYCYHSQNEDIIMAHYILQLTFEFARKSLIKILANCVTLAFINTNNNLKFCLLTFLNLAVEISRIYGQHLKKKSISDTLIINCRNVKKLKCCSELITLFHPLDYKIVTKP